MWWDGGWGGWLAMAVMMLAFWGGLIVLVVWVLRSGASQQEVRRRELGPTALQILDERFARGEIDRDEYESRRQTLLGSVSGSG